MLTSLLKELPNQLTYNLFRYSIVVVDNDHKMSARNVVSNIKKQSLIDIEYYIEPVQNIALARNKAVENAKGNFIAFIDDDEFPICNWLFNLYKTYDQTNADGILGPVIPYYYSEPPKWIMKGKFHERPNYKTGSLLHWTNTRTGNVLLKKDIFYEKENMFGPEFGKGCEDIDFFKRMIKKGYIFVWCAEAVVYEIVPPERFTRSFMIKRALLRGQISRFNFFDYIKSLIAIPIYTLILPFLILMGQHLFMKYLIKDFDHIGRILGGCGLKIIHKR